MAMQLAVALLFIAACRGEDAPPMISSDAGTDSPPRCGDAFCDPGETPDTCPVDCGDPCGDGLCDFAESTVECPTDCGYCDDGVCRDDERRGACPLDCEIECGDRACEGAETPSTCPSDCAVDCAAAVSVPLVVGGPAGGPIEAGPAVAYSEDGITYVAWGEDRVVVVARVTADGSVTREAVATSADLVRGVALSTIRPHVALGWSDSYGVATRVLDVGKGVWSLRAAHAPGHYGPRMTPSGGGWLVTSAGPEGMDMTGLYLTGETRSGFYFPGTAISPADVLSEPPSVIVSAWFGKVGDDDPFGLQIARSEDGDVTQQPTPIDLGSSPARPALVDMPGTGVLVAWVRDGTLRRAFVASNGDVGSIWPERPIEGAIRSVSAAAVDTTAFVTFATETAAWMRETDGEGRALGPAVTLGDAAPMGTIDTAWAEVDLAVTFVAPSPAGPRIVLVRVTPCH